MQNQRWQWHTPRQPLPFTILQTTESLVYCPPGFADSEDGVGNVVEGSWRNEDSNMVSISRAGGNRYVLGLLVLS